MNAPFLSIVMIGRNDAYISDYLYRLSSTILFWQKGFKESKKSFEIVLVDWGSKTPLSKDLIPLVEGHEQIPLRIIEVPPAKVAQYSKGKNFYSTLAVNVGVRRAKGEFILFTGTDTLMPIFSLETLIRKLQKSNTKCFDLKKSYLHVPRYNIPFDIVQRQPSTEEWEIQSELLTENLIPEAPGSTFLGGFAGGQLMHRKLWMECQGYNEALNKTWGWCDNEMVLRLSEKYPWVNLAPYGIYMLHMEHGPQVSIETKKPRDPNTTNPMLISKKIKVNKDIWGLQGIKLKEVNLNKNSQKTDHKTTKSTSLFDIKDLTTSNTWAYLKKIFNNGTFDRSQLEAAVSLLIYSKNNKISDIYYFGSPQMKHLYSALSFRRGAHLFFINTWKEGIQKNESKGNPSELSGILSHVIRHRGRTEYINTEITNALKISEKRQLTNSGLKSAIIWVNSFKKSELKTLFSNKKFSQFDFVILSSDKEIISLPDKKLDNKARLENWNPLKNFKSPLKKLEYSDVSKGHFLKELILKSDQAYTSQTQKNIIILKST